ncbi:cell wall-binding protein [Clostridium chromiireducens]|uniref:cell wall-binding protein n=1 Tax=Clostridium chromiireducens TaxID=225345 RepID=UPI003AF689B6
MKRLKPTKILVNSLLIVSVLVLNPMGANAEWRQNSIGWWFTEGNSWSVGWRVIDEKWYYFGQDGYMKTGWLQDSDGKWYYLNSDGSMAHDTTIDGYTIGSDGARNQSVQSSFEQSTTTENILSNANLSHTTISGVTGVKFDDITKIVFSDGRGRNKPVTVEDKQKIREFMEYLNGYGVKKTVNPESIGWIYRGIFYINEKEVMDITFVNPIIINGDYFNITKGELDTVTIGKFIKSIDSSYDVMAGL